MTIRTAIAAALVGLCLASCAPTPEPDWKAITKYIGEQEKERRP